MHADRSSVVRNPSALDEEKFHAVVMEAISRAISKTSRARVAQVMEISTRQLENIGKGAMPNARSLANLRALGPDLLDPIHREYGERSVPRDAVCSTDPISSKLAALLAKTIEMERPDSDGGAASTLAELLSLGEDERLLRQCARTFAGWVEMIDAYRAGQKPRLVTEDQAA